MYHYSRTYTPPKMLGLGSYIVPAGVEQDPAQMAARQIATEIADRVVEIARRGQVSPEDLEKFTEAVSRGAQPIVRTASQEIVPKVVFWGVLGMIGVGLLSSYVTRQTIRKTRPNPRRRRYRLRRAA